MSSFLRQSTHVNIFEAILIRPLVQWASTPSYAVSWPMCLWFDVSLGKSFFPLFVNSSRYCYWHVCHTGKSNGLQLAYQAILGRFWEEETMVGIAAGWFLFVKMLSHESQSLKFLHLPSPSHLHVSPSRRLVLLPFPEGGT